MEENRNQTFKDFSMERGLDAGYKRAERKVEKHFFEPMHWTTLDNKEFSKQRWLVQNLIPYEGFVILASVTGEKKTWFAMEMARCIALGIDFLGNKDFKTEAGNVLYVDMEMSQSEAQRRGKQLGFSETNKKILVYSDTELDLNEDRGVDWLLNVIDYYDIKVVFLDTFRAVAGGIKEEKADEIRTFFNRLKILKDKGVAVVFLDHFRKPSNFEGKVPKKEFLFGSTDKTASVEILLMLKSEPGGEEIDVYQRKNRLTREINPFKTIIRDHVKDEIVKTELTYGGEIEDQENKKEEAKEKILDILPDGSKTKREMVEMLKKTAGTKNVQMALIELVNEGMIDCVKQGRQNLYFLPREEEKPLVEDEKGLF
ncbi:MAG TPA: AAA family ATPase [Candidatus Paceibacterota bacterium]